jgi:hypothetical protein
LFIATPFPPIARTHTACIIIRSMRIVPIIFAAVLSLIAARAWAQDVPPFNGGGTIYEPEIGVVSTGAISDVQVAVSEDLRYVQINVRASNSGLLSLNTFQVAQARALSQSGGGSPQGFVGNGGFLDEGAAEDRGGRGSAAFRGSPTNTSPTAILKTDPNAIHSMLRSPGMFRLTVGSAK